MESLPDYAAVVLAAGASTRLGEPKQLLHYKGESLLRLSVRAATDAGCRPVIIVVGFEAARMKAGVSGTNAICVENGEWQSGLASSIRIGLNAAMDSSPLLQGVLLMVCDQPFIHASLLTKLIGEAALADAPAASSYAGVLGVPAAFPRRMWPRLLRLKGDEGARRILAQCDDVVAVEFGEGAIDIDTPEDLVGLRG